MRERLGAAIAGFILGFGIVFVSSVVGKEYLTPPPSMNTIEVSPEEYMALQSLLINKQEQIEQRTDESRYWLHEYFNLITCIDRSDNYLESKACIGVQYTLLNENK